MKEIISIILGIAALAVAAAVTWKWYKKYQLRKKTDAEDNCK